jgi:hypothetical protein
VTPWLVCRSLARPCNGLEPLPKRAQRTRPRVRFYILATIQLSSSAIAHTTNAARHIRHARHGCLSPGTCPMPEPIAREAATASLA